MPPGCFSGMVKAMPKHRQIKAPNGATLAQVFGMRVTPAVTEDCILWDGAKSKNGYGNINFRGQTLGAHRVAWELRHGPIADGLHVLHSCERRLCVNVAHMRLCTLSESIADKVARSREAKARITASQPASGPDLWRKLEARAIPEPNSGCLLWLGGVNKDGYGQFAIRRRQHGAHTVALMATKGPIPKGMFVCHRCDVRSCINPEHLFLGTHADNMADRDAKGRAARGERNAGAKISAADVLEIRRSPESNQAAAIRYGIAESTVSFIRTRRTWRHL